MTSLKERIFSLPGMREWRRKRAVARFLSPDAYGMHYGKFSTFTEARAWLPQSDEFEQQGFQDEYLEKRTKRVYSFDYPVMFWLREAFSNGTTSICDVGGSVGVHFYSYQNYLRFPDGIRWTVLEVPATSELGRAYAAKRGVSEQLQFVPGIDPDRIDADMLISAGTIEFLEEWPLPELLRRSRRQPTHLILNKLPLSNRAAFISTQNIGGGAFTPHHVFLRSAYIADLEQLGYELVDNWPVPDRRFDVPGGSELAFGDYSGLYLRKR